MSNVKIIKADWAHDQSALKDIRTQVFVNEQQVPEALEWDDLDDTAEHWLALIDNTPIACARVIDKKKIGRMAVLRPYRNMQIGSKLLNAIKEDSSKPDALQLSAQCHAFSFYLSNGFTAASESYEDAGIPHIDMKSGNLSHNQYVFNKDKNIYHGSTEIETQGLFDLLLCQTDRSIVISTNDLSHPVLRHDNLIQSIKKAAKKSRHFKFYLLLSTFNAKDIDHPLFKLQDRLSSFIQIKKTDESVPNQILMDATAWIDFDSNETRACFSDKAKIKYFMERYNQWWHNAKPVTQARRLSI